MILLGALLGASTAASAQVDLTAPPTEVPSGEAGQAQRDPTITMFDNFSISGVVAGMCKPPDEATMGRFMQNLDVVHQLTLRHMHQQMPDKSSKEIGDILLSRMRSLNQLASGAVQTKGCTDPEIIRLVDAFAANAALDFSTKQ
ncbi:hypothetical protein [Emcibacter sp. SYSU 3D8]|uniref:hypothetical protein n=1 Tax=Emcibacter sp. SYSU 3D8 TaxID=3133969 RepID=UPI0031FF3BF1